MNRRKWNLASALIVGLFVLYVGTYIVDRTLSFEFQDRHGPKSNDRVIYIGITDKDVAYVDECPRDSTPETDPKLRRIMSRRNASCVLFKPAAWLDEKLTSTKIDTLRREH